MQKIPVDKYVECVESIYIEMPDYRIGGDGSDGTCDCIGMGRGALERAGVDDVKNMRGTNQAARKTFRNLQKIRKESQLRKGDIVLKVRDKDDKEMPLPSQYRKGGSEYNADVGEINFVHYGTVSSVNPLVITHMTSPKPKKDTTLGKWTYFAQLPWVAYDEEQGPVPDVAVVYAESGKTVKMRAKPSAMCRLYWDIPIGTEVVLVTPGDKWSEIIAQGRSGYMLSKYLYTKDDTCTLIIPGLTRAQAAALMVEYPEAEMISSDDYGEGGVG